MHHIHSLFLFISHHAELAYGTVFMIAFSESLALVGLLIPGTVIMFGMGAVVATGSLGLTPVLLFAIAGAIAGDGVSFWIGRRYKERLKGIWPFSRYPVMIRNGEAFFHRHGAKSVLFGRFVGPIRPVIPVVAGMMGMIPMHFGIVNVLSAIGWAFVYILPGVFFGASLGVAGAISLRLTVFVSFLVVCIWSVFWFSRKLVSLLEYWGPIGFSALKQWATPDPGVQGRMPAVKRLLSFLFLRKQGEEVLFGFLVLTFFVALWGFLGVLQDVLAKDPLVIVDQSVYHFFQALRTSWADSVIVAITECGDFGVTLYLFLSVLIVLLVARCYRTAIYWAVTVLGGLGGVQLLKWAIHLPRPVAIYHGSSAYSFPSGHTTMSVILYGFLALVLARGLASTWRWTLFSSVVVISCVIGISRLYLGAHWLSDVLGGLLIGTSWTALLGIAYLKGSPEIIPRRWMGLTVVLVIMISGSWHVAQRHKNDLAFYAPQSTIQAMSFASWQNSGWRTLPAWRIDMEGEQEQPLTLQWVGSLDDLTHHLMNRGWQPPPVLSLKRFLGMFSPATPMDDILVLPRLHDGRAECLRLVHWNQGRRLVLRLWPSGVIISGDKTPLFIGTVEEQDPHQLAGLFTGTRDTGEYERPLNALVQGATDQFNEMRVHRMDHEARPEQPHLSWNGSVSLIWEKTRD